MSVLIVKENYMAAMKDLLFDIKECVDEGMDTNQIVNTLGCTYSMVYDALEYDDLIEKEYNE